MRQNDRKRKSRKPKQSPKDGNALEEVVLDIDSVAFGGKGVAKNEEGKVFFIRHCVTGDKVKAEVKKSKKKFAEGVATQILEKAEIRGAARCSHFGDCGGCDWQDIPYSKQSEWKLDFIRSGFKRIGKLADIPDIQFLKTPNKFHYRSRVLFRCHLSGGQLSMGFFRRATRELVKISKCHIAEPAINTFLDYCHSADWSACPEQKFRVELQVVPQGNNYPKDDTFEDLESAKQAKLIITVFPADGRKQDMEPIVTVLKSSPQVLSCSMVFDLKSPKHLDDSWVLFESYNGVEYHALPGQFHQVNVPHNRILRELVLTTVRQRLVEGKGQKLMDVFCGGGNLSLQLSPYFDWVDGVEMNPRAIQAATKSAEENGFENCRFESGDAVAYLKRHRKKTGYDFIILDPPRDGFYDGIKSLLDISPRYILYVSCDPMTLARDLGALCSESYKLAEISCLDFFPHTFHIETCVLLEKV